jgi:hypothetical protein
MEQILTSSMVMEPRQFTSMDQIQEWKMNPWQIMAAEHPVFTQMCINSGNRMINLEAIYKKIRRGILEGEGNVVNINILGPNGAGKGILGQGFGEAIRRDDYLHYEARKKGFAVDSFANLFALTIKALQLPRYRDTPWAILPEIEHGQFTPEQYQKADDFSFYLRDKVRQAPDGLKVVYINERPAPTAYPVSRDTHPDLTGINRALGSIYADAYDPAVRDQTHFFILKRNDGVRGMAVDDRNAFKNPEQQFENPFTGHNRFWLPSDAGAFYDVATLSPNIQLEALKLLQLGTASPNAINRGDLELYELAVKLLPQGKIPSPSIDHYLEFLRGQLISTRKNKPGLLPSQVRIVQNLPISDHSERAEYNFTNLTQKNLAVLLAPELLPPMLRKFVLGI